MQVSVIFQIVFQVRKDSLSYLKEVTTLSIGVLKKSNAKLLARVDIGEVQRLVDDKEIKDINWIPSNEMLGDGLTKRDRYVEKLQEILI